jgi:hypothetical protein
MFQFFTYRLSFNLLLAKKKQKRATVGNPTATDANRFLLNIDVQSIDDMAPGLSSEDQRHDIKQFFHPGKVLEGKERSGKGSGKYCCCKLCL